MLNQELMISNKPPLSSAAQRYDQFFYGESTQNKSPVVLGDLPGFDFCVSPKDQAGEIVKALEDDPRLPGLLIYDQNKYIGYLSRRRIFEWLGKPYATEVFLKRNIATLYDTIRYPQQALPFNLLIQEALQFAVNRDISFIYEPLLVEDEAGNVKLIDFQVLIIAQSRILEQANSIVQQQIEIGTILTGSLELKQVLLSILESQYQVVNFDKAGIYLVDGDQLVLQSEFSKYTNFAIEIPTIECNIYQQIYYSKQPIRSQEYGEFVDFSLFDRGGDALNWMIVPLVYQNQILGLIVLSRNHAERFSNNDVISTKTIAQYASIAIHNAKIYHDLNQLNHQLEKVVTQKTQDLQVVLDKLEVLNQAKTNFLAFTSSQISEPLSKIRSISLKMAYDQQQNCSESDVSQLNTIYKESGKIGQVLERMSDLVKIEQGQLTLRFQSVDLGVMIKRVIQDLNVHFMEKQISLEMDPMWGLPRIVGDHNALYKVFTQSILNAVDYTPRYGLVKINGKISKPNQNYLGIEAVEIHISDNGVGMDEKYHQVIFERFYRLEIYDQFLANKEEKLGLGLAITKGVIDAHRGMIRMESCGYDPENRKGCDLVILLPVNQSGI